MSECAQSLTANHSPSSNTVSSVGGKVERRKEVNLIRSTVDGQYNNRTCDDALVFQPITSCFVILLAVHIVESVRIVEESNTPTPQY